jgi:NAD(P)-dependent dehydrogenase (short-subunit alcohol dehydrogenase family)
MSVFGAPQQEDAVKSKKVWFITGAGRGLGVDIVQAALSAGHSVVATGRDLGQLEKALGQKADLLPVELDITSPADAKAAVKKAVERFGRIDVLVNNAGNFYAGFFEDLTQDEVEKQVATNLFGPMNVTRAVLPVFRQQRSGLIMTLSSSAGLTGIEFGSAYAASKFGIEGWMRSLRVEVAPFGIKTTIVNPGFFRTDLLSKQSMFFASEPTDDYKEQREQMQSGWSAMAGTQGGDPKKLAGALIKIAAESEPPQRFVAGADAVATAKQVAAELLSESEAYLELSSSLGFTKAGS